MPTALLVEALLALARDAELAQVLAAALGEREALMAALVAGGQADGELADDVSAEAAARFALMLGLGSMLVRALDLPPADPADWTTFMRRLVGAFTQEHPMTDLDRDVNSVDEIVVERDPALLDAVDPRDRPAQRRAVHLGLRAQPPGAGEAVREGQDLAVERHHRPAVGHRGRLGQARPS